MNTLHKETRAALSYRIKNAKALNDMERCERQITRHYEAGTIGPGDLASLDRMIMTRKAKL